MSLNTLTKSPNPLFSKSKKRALPLNLLNQTLMKSPPSSIIVHTLKTGRLNPHTLLWSQKKAEGYSSPPYLPHVLDFLSGVDWEWRGVSPAKLVSCASLRPVLLCSLPTAFNWLPELWCFALLPLKPAHHHCQLQKVSTWEHEQCLITNTSVLATVELLLCYLFNKSGDWFLCRLIIRTHLCQAAKRNSAFVQDVYFYQCNLLTESHSLLASHVAIKFFILGGEKEAFSKSCLFMDFCNPRQFCNAEKTTDPTSVSLFA